jgi:hypothetical protein
VSTSSALSISEVVDSFFLASFCCAAGEEESIEALDELDCKLQNGLIRREFDELKITFVSQTSLTLNNSVSSNVCYFKNCDF